MTIKGCDLTGQFSLSFHGQSVHFATRHKEHKYGNMKIGHKYLAIAVTCTPNNMFAGYLSIA
jgi:hypothetical protein